MKKKSMLLRKNKKIKSPILSNARWTCYSHLSNRQGGGNKQGGGTKVVNAINVEEAINEEVERNLRNQKNKEGWFFFQNQ